MSRKPKTKAGKKSEAEPKRHIFMPGKRKIVGVEDISDKSGYYDLFDDLPPFSVNVDPSIMTKGRLSETRLSPVINDE
jgi:hypothetical protein